MNTSDKNIFLAYVPFTGLGLYGGFRGNRWLRNRITVFKHFVIPSLLNQTDQDFTLWIGWRPEERNNKYVAELAKWLHENTKLTFVFTFGGLCFWDDKYSDAEAWDRLATALHRSAPELFDAVGQVDSVTMLIQPSDDLYQMDTIGRMKIAFAEDPTLQAITYRQGYHMNYVTKELHTYNPTTNPPFFAYKMPKEVFLDPIRHMTYTGPYKSHEYIGDKMKLGVLEGRGFLVGSHTENISTHANHPFVGRETFDAKTEFDVQRSFGIDVVPRLLLPRSLRKEVMRRLPYQWQRKLRYIFGERIGNTLYNVIRN